MYTSNGHRKKPDGLVIENYTVRKRRSNFTPHIKSVVQPKKIKRRVTSHFFQPIKGQRVVDTLCRPCPGPHPVETQFNFLRINHYWCKSKEEWMIKAARGRPDLKKERIPHNPAAFEQFHGGPMVYDESALRFVKEMRKRVYG